MTSPACDACGDSGTVTFQDHASAHPVVEACPVCLRAENDATDAAMTMLVFVAKCILIVVTLIGLGLAVMWGGV